MSHRGSSEYDPRGFPPFAVTVDIVLFAIFEDALQVLLVERGVEPFRGSWALPGGFVRPDEDLDAAAARELAEETGVDSSAAYLEQLATYGAPNRDPRMRVVTVAYWAACERVPTPTGGSDAARAVLVPVSSIVEGAIELAFDHLRIAKHALERLRAKLEYTAVAARFCGPEFTISDLRRVYEVVWDTQLDPGNFQRKVRENHAFSRAGDYTVAMALPSLVLEAGPLLGPSVYSAGDALDDGPEDLFEAEAAIAYGESAAALADDEESPAEQRFEMGGGPPAEQAPARRRAVKMVTSPGPRGGRPASLWTAADPGRKLNSPIARR